MVGRKLIGRLAAAGAVAGFAFVAVVALGATLYALLSMVLVPAGAAALTALIAAAAAGLCAWIAAGKALGDSEPEEPVGLGQRAVELFRQRPILGAAAALAAAGSSCATPPWRPWWRPPSPRPATPDAGASASWRPPFTLT